MQDPDINWTTYIYGYKQAGDILVHYLKTAAMHKNLLVFPIVFLYRQCLELYLKRIIRDGNALLDDKPNFPKKHDLKMLWAVCKTIIEKVPNVQDFVS